MSLSLNRQTVANYIIVMKQNILLTRPERLSLVQMLALHEDAVLRTVYNRRWNVALF